MLQIIAEAQSKKHSMLLTQKLEGFVSMQIIFISIILFISMYLPGKYFSRNKNAQRPVSGLIQVLQK